MASFGVDIWDPRNVGSHSTDEKSRDQWVNRGGGGGGMCMRGSGIYLFYLFIYFTTHYLQRKNNSKSNYVMNKWNVYE